MPISLNTRDFKLTYAFQQSIMLPHAAQIVGLIPAMHTIGLAVNINSSDVLEQVNFSVIDTKMQLVDSYLNKLFLVGFFPYRGFGAPQDYQVWCDNNDMLKTLKSYY